MPAVSESKPVPSAPSPAMPPKKRVNWTLFLLIFLLALWILTAIGLGYLFLQNRELRREFEMPPQATPAFTPSPTPASKENEIVSVDDEWNLYMNYDLGFSMKIPKNIYHGFGACDWKEDENSYRPKLASVPVKVFEDTNNVFISTEYYYSLSGERIEEDIHYYSSCDKVENSLTRLRDKNVFQQQDWEIIGAEVANDTQLTKFIQDNYGAGCGLGEKKVSSQEGVFDIEITRGESCPINYMYYLKYAPDKGRAITWVFGQAYNFYKDANHAAYDEDMVASFRMID
jgi:hypothetical protein